MKEYLNDVRMMGQGDGARNHLNKKKSEALEHGGACNIQGVFFNWASPENVSTLSPPPPPPNASTGPPTLKKF